MIIQNILKYILIYLALFFVFLSLWLERKFGSVSLSQLLFHTTLFSDGLFTADPEYISSFIRSVLLASVYAAVGIYVLESLFYQKKRERLTSSIRVFFKPFIWVFKNTILKLKIPTIRKSNGFSVSLSLLLFVLSLSCFLYSLNAFSSVRTLFTEQTDQIDNFAPLYTAPSDVTLPSGQPKNLVLIYVESLESAYSNPDLVGSGWKKDIKNSILTNGDCMMMICFKKPS